MARSRAAPKSQTKARPESAQLKAIDRLLEDRQYPEAIRKIRAALRRFPDHSGLHRALVEALEQEKGPRAAGLAAFAWSERRPNSPQAQQSLLRFATILGHLMLADRTAARVRALGGQTPGFPLDPSLVDSLLDDVGAREAGVDAMVRFDIGRVHLESRDFAGTLRWLDGVEVPAARNNRALALFHLDRVDEALDLFVANSQQDPDNLFALAWAARLRLYQGDATSARGLSTPLAATAARRPDDALPQIETLLMLGEDQGAWEAFGRARAQDWFDTRSDVTRAMLWHFGACAACRLGNIEDARQWWHAALGAKSDFALASTNLDPSSDMATESRLPSIYDGHHLLPHAWTKALLADKTDGPGEIDKLTASNAYLESLYLGGDESLRSLIGIILKLRAARGDAAAADLLRDFARRPIGTRDERFGFLTFLQSQHLLGPTEPVAYWDGKQMREVTVRGTAIYREPNESGLPPDLDTLLSEAITLYNEDRPDEAELRLQTVLKRAPDHPVVLMNLAAVRGAQGQSDESLRLLQDLVAQHPDYLFARCTLAQRLIEQGELEEAQDLLDGLTERERLHIQEAFLLWGTLAMLNKARGEEDAAQMLLNSLESMVDDDDDARRLARIKEHLASLDPRQRVQQALKRPLRADPKLAKRPG